MKQTINHLYSFLLLIVLCVVSVSYAYAQNYENSMNSSMTNIFGEQLLTERQQFQQDSIRRNQGLSSSERTIYFNRYKDSIQVYKIISARGDTSIVDTTLKISDIYRVNPTRRDEYGYMPFPNLAEGYTPMVLDIKPTLTPDYGMESREMYWYRVDDIRYFNVKTPWSEVMYHSNVFSNMTGQILDFNFTANAGKKFNFSVGYRGKRTNGLYNYSETHHGQFLATFNYRTESYRYRIKGHFTYQFLSASENGGLTEEGDSLFRSDDKEFSYRRTLPVRLSGSDDVVGNRLGGSRIYVMQEYDLFASAVKNPRAFRVTLLGEMMYDHKTYRYTDPAFSSNSETARKSLAYYGSNVYAGAPVSDSSIYNTVEVAAGAGVNFPLVNLYAQGMIRYSSTSYDYDTVAVGSSMEVEPQKGGTVALNLMGRWRPFKYFGADARFDYNLSGEYSGASILDISAYFKLSDDYVLRGSLMNASYYPSLVSMYYRSSYENFNWKNDFSRINATRLSVAFESPKILDARLDFTTIDNYVYYDSLRIPRQYGERIDVLALTLHRDLRYKAFGWDNTFTYQNVSSGSSVMPLPEIMLRSTLYAHFPMFKKAMTLM
ncbi:MAG: hypothetical protein II285_00230, partial [Flavobacteriales bacterium]|nr:hypothetical protein [Flavobacteriales bacterium]